MTANDVGLLSPVTAGHDDAVTDAAVLAALVTAEVALVRAAGALGLADAQSVDAVSHLYGWTGAGHVCAAPGVDVDDLARDAVAGGNPVIPLVGILREGAGAAGVLVHRGATSQDIIDSALMLISARAVAEASRSLAAAEATLARLAADHRDDVAVARTLTQHAVPTTVGARFAGWLRGIRRARERLDAAAAALPAQLGGAGGTLASFVELYGEADAAALPAAFAAELGLQAPDAPWHTTRWPVTELGDALVQVVDAAGKVATDVATLSRSEIGELAEGAGGGSSAMPHKRNPAASVLIRSAALRAPQLGATLHLAAATAADERPDGAWHAEWPALRELLRLALGVSANLAALAAGLRVAPDAVARNLAAAGDAIVSEQRALGGSGADPAAYVGLARRLADAAGPTEESI